MINNVIFVLVVSILLYWNAKLFYKFYRLKTIKKLGMFAIARAYHEGVSLDVINRYHVTLKKHGPGSSQTEFFRREYIDDMDFLDFADEMDILREEMEAL